MGFLAELYKQLAMAFMPLSLALMLVAYLKITDDNCNKHHEESIEEKPKTKVEERIEKRKHLIQELESIIK